jgi:hypothetical protein
MWTRIVGGLVLLIGASFGVQWLFPRTRGQKVSRQYVRWDVAPIVGFLGLLLAALSFVEAQRGDVIPAWGLGGAFGLVLGLGMWVALMYWGNRPAAPARKNESAFRLAWQFIRTYGILFLIALFGLNVAIRWLGAALEVFTAGALGVFVMATAAAVFARTAVAGKR